MIKYSMCEAAAVATIPPVAQPAKTTDLSKAVIFTTSGLGGMAGWAIVHPANT
jgi:hypothetical protein